MTIAAIKKSAALYVLFSLFGSLIVSFSGAGPSLEIEGSCRKFVSTNLSESLLSIEESKAILSSGLARAKKIKRLTEHYRRSRQSYKQIEFFVEYYSPYEAKHFINGPLVPKHDFDVSGKVIPPQGYQVVEEALFSADKFDSLQLLTQYTILTEKFSFLQKHYSTISIELPNLVEAIQLQMIRIMCLTLNGYDCTINKESITETSYAIEGLQKCLGNFNKSESLKSLESSLKQCSAFLKKNPDSDTFDRLAFTTDYLAPAYASLVRFKAGSGIPSSPLNYAIDLNAPSIFDIGSFKTQYFSLYLNDTVNIKLKAQLGKLLFFDPVLSSNTRRACASCHQPAKAFTDGVSKSVAFDGNGTVSRNAPTLLNAAYQKLFFYDGRLVNLEEQANAVFHNSSEMNSSAAEIVNRLRTSEDYRALFARAYKGTKDTGISFFAVLKSIAEFVKTLDARNSRFDHYLRGDDSQLSAAEIRGYNLFSGKALCGSCHFFPLFNGSVPPMYNDNEFEVIGTPLRADNKILDTDTGRGKISGMPIHYHAFKTPTIRNIAVTAPYMHNGVYSSLDQVLEFYNKGGGAGLGLMVENQTLPFDSLRLTKPELNELKSFLLSLTDTTKLPQAPDRLPSFPDARLNKRKIGGEY